MIARNKKQTFKTIIDSEPLVLVDFFTEWCGPCKMIGPFIEELADEMDNVKFVKVDIDKNSAYAAKYGVMSIPNLLLFKDGEIVNRQIGALPKSELKAFIENSIN